MDRTKNGVTYLREQVKPSQTLEGVVDTPHLADLQEPTQISRLSVDVAADVYNGQWLESKQLLEKRLVASLPGWL
jgi:hypothetical protein